MAYETTAPDTAVEAEPEYTVSDEDLLKMCKAERLTSVGFDGEDDLAEQREEALEYIKGVMSDLPAMKGRSKAMSSDVADAIETVLPDLMEILAGGEDVGTFKPDGPDDDEAAKQETEYVNEVIFDQNPGFVTLYQAIRDALSVKTGIVKSWWQDYEYAEERLSGKNVVEMEMAKAGAEISEVTDDGHDEMGGPLYAFTVKKIARNGCAKIAAVDVTNFGVSRDTVRLADTPYCIERSWPRAFELTDMGYEAEQVQLLKGISSNRDDETQRARDTVEESDSSQIIHDDTRRTVEVHTHTIRVDLEGKGKTAIWEVVSDSDEKILLSKRKRNRVGYAAGTPFLNSHRFYGSSLADKLMEVQRIKTVLLRMMLDNGYFAINERMEVSEQESSLNTIADLLRNEPGYPVRSKTGKALRPIKSAGLDFDVTGALEYMSTVAEGRSGVVRNAQGLNPDTLHDTKGGMEKLFSAAQRRVRMIARVLAETLLKDLFLNVHGDIRDHATHTQQMRAGSKWVPINPTSWGQRNDMTIELGVGSGGKEAEILAMREIIGMQMSAIEGQAAGMIKGKLVTEKELYHSANRMVGRLGFKAPELYFRDPEEAAKEAAMKPPEEPAPDPEAMKAQAEMQAMQAKMQMQQAEAEQKMQLAQKQAEFDAQTRIAQMHADQQAAQQKIAADVQAAREKAQLEIELAQQKASAEMNLARERMQGEMQLARERQELEGGLSMMKAQHDASLKQNRPGGDLDK